MLHHMFGRLLLLLICICFAVSGFCADNPARSVYRLMVFGDSLSAGYRLKSNESFGQRLQVALNNAGLTQVQVINVSRSGMTTSGGLNLQPQALKQKPDGVLLELGINDVLRGNSVSQTKENLSKLIENFQSDNIAVLLAGMKAPPITEPVYARQFEQMYVDLAHKYRIMLYPFFMQGIFNAAGNQFNQALPYLQQDKAHPTANGVQLMVDDILPTILNFLKKQGITPVL